MACAVPRIFLPLASTGSFEAATATTRPLKAAIAGDAATGSMLSLEIIDADGVSQIVKFKEPLMLPGPA